ncbi:hypothetical protein [Streptomyces sp. NPDC002209]|uniref:hypothetical protein n=1 Tax=Streptomyces sp. NPDC002209 TaxID=3364638 RepID=UPI003675637A
MDVESVALELYGLRPSEFAAARDAYVAKAREAGDKQLAAAIGALRKPTLAAVTAAPPPARGSGQPSPAR